MAFLDVLYRALKNYTSEIKNDRILTQERRAIVASNPGQDSIEVVRNVCTVESDWIEAIEQGLIHVGRAIDEQRQFIRTRGEVVPIEKVKRVSKDSVEHLAKHSDLVTKEYHNEDFVPDKLYVVERLSDFAVYENKFLYMLLQYLDSFVNSRYKKLSQLSNVYRGYTRINKTVAINDSKLVFGLNISDERVDDPCLKQNNPLADTLARISHLMKEISHYLNTPLMQEVGKEPVLKPPITKTNVLKMNKHFKGAMALYGFVTAYDKEGYCVEEVRQTMSPLSENTAEEMAYIATLAAFVAYKEGLGLDKQLYYEYLREQERRKSIEDEKHNRHINALKRRVEESGEGVLEYMLELEKRNKALEQDSAERDNALREVSRLNTQIDELLLKIKSLTERINSFDKELDGVGIKHEKERENIIEKHRMELTQITDKHNLEREKLIIEQKVVEEDFRTKINKLEELRQQEAVEYSSKLELLTNDYLKQIQELSQNHETRIEKLEATNKLVSTEYKKIEEEKTLISGKLMALRVRYNDISAEEDFTSREAFVELEAQMKALRRFFKEQWGKTKKRIRKEILSKPSEEQNSSHDISGK